MRKLGLVKKPLIYKIIAVLSIFEPLIKIYVLKITSGHKLNVLFEALNSQGTIFELTIYYLFFPLAGLSLWKIRRHTFFIFLIIQLYLIYSYFSFVPYSWPYYTLRPFFIITFTAVLSFLMILLFLHPKIREPFFNSAIRWWESKTRYEIDLECRLIDKENNFINTKILNISQTGVFLKYLENKENIINQLYNLEFSINNISFSIPVNIKAVHQFNNTKGIGAQFIPSFKERINLIKLGFYLKKNKYRPLR